MDALSDPKKSGILSESEVRALALALVDGSGDAGFSEGDLEDLVALAEETRIVGRLLKLVMTGRADVRRREDGEWQWRRAERGLT